jgi:hypothetical protein
MPADKAARIIIRRLARNKPRITFPWQIVLGISLVAALPQDFGNFLMRRIPFKE